MLQLLRKENRVKKKCVCVWCCACMRGQVGYFSCWGMARCVVIAPRFLVAPLLPAAVSAQPRVLRTSLATHTPANMLAHSKTDQACPYADRFPKPKKTGKAHVDCELESHRVKCVEVVKRLIADPSQGTVLMGMLEARDRNTSTEKEESTHWHSAYCYLDKIGKDCCTEWMVRLASSKGCPEVNLDILNRVDMRDIGNIKRLVFFIIAAAPSTKLPRPALDNTVCAETLNRRAVQCGDRIKMVGACISAEGIVDWKRLGVYALVWETAPPAAGAVKKCVKIVHRPSKTEAMLPSHILIDASFELSGNESDWESRAKKGVAEYRLCDFFRQAGPAMGHPDRKKGVALHMLAEEEEEEKIMKARAEVVEVGVSSATSALEASVNKRRQEVAERARATRAAGGGVKRARTLVRLASEPVAAIEAGTSPS